jgi:Ca-activated chloride channel family protein
VSDHPLSTFSIDVDGASYTNARRFIRDGETPPKDAVRIEEFLNYFQYDYPAPTAEDEHPFSVTMEGGAAPWRENHELVHVGLQGQRVPVEERPPSNLVFLIDVSGSMRSPQKLPLLKRGFRMLADQLRPEDRVAIVVYAGASGVVLESTPGDETDAIKGAIEQLRAGGSTAGAEGIRNAYSVAEEHFIEDGINRVILATDGDFNVGVSSDAQLQRLVEEKRDGGTALTVLGFGTGNLKDNKMETLANHGNGNYYYVDSASESRRVLVEELGSTLQTIAKDVKVQVEFNPAEVRAYRLIGYVNRELEDEEFADDSTDAGELGAGHSVTALYEVIRRGVESDVEVPTAGELKYQDKPEPNEEAASDELLTVNLRYKQPDGDTSQLLKRPLSKDVLEQEVSGDFHFAAAVAGLGMLLRDSEYKGDLALDDVRGLAEEGRGDDPRGTRAGFISLLEDARGLLPAESSEGPASNQ